MVRDGTCGRGPPSGRRDRHGLEGGHLDVAVDGAHYWHVVFVLLALQLIRANGYRSTRSPSTSGS